MPAIAVVQHLASKPHTRDLVYRQLLTVIAHVYRGDSRNQVDHGIRSVVMCEKEVHHLTEDQFLEAIRIVFQPTVPIVYPDQFRPLLIIASDGKILWKQSVENPT